jgi:hypothetical protein
MKQIQQLNRRLGDALGYVLSGTEPRFCWKWAPDIPYWASRLGKVWVLCQWQKPGMSEQEWNKQFQGRFPYPVNGMHHAHPETVLPPGQVPTPELTQNYIRALDQQMSKTLVDQFCDVQNELAADKERDDVEWVERVQDSNPAFSNFNPGNRGGHVSYGGAG